MRRVVCSEAQGAGRCLALLLISQGWKTGLSHHRPCIRHGPTARGAGPCHGNAARRTSARRRWPSPAPVPPPGPRRAATGGAWAQARNAPRHRDPRRWWRPGGAWSWTAWRPSLPSRGPRGTPPGDGERVGAGGQASRRGACGYRWARKRVGAGADGKLGNPCGFAGRHLRGRLLPQRLGQLPLQRHHLDCQQLGPLLSLHVRGHRHVLMYNSQGSKIDVTTPPEESP